MSCLPGGLGCVSEGVGVHRHAIAACIVGLASLLAGCSLFEGKPKVVQVECGNDYYPHNRDDIGAFKGSTLYFYWSDSTITSRDSEGWCPISFVPKPKSLYP